jgi:hypothetical protein
MLAVSAPVKKSKNCERVMSASHQCLSVDGEQIGDLVSVGAQVTFFTVCADLRDLDGRIFRSAEEVRRAVDIARTRLAALRQPAASQARVAAAG